jgi:hypothetical protein
MGKPMTVNRKRHVNINLDDISIERLKDISETMGDVGISAAIRWLAAEEDRRQQARDAA